VKTRIPVAPTWHDMLISYCILALKFVHNKSCRVKRHVEVCRRLSLSNGLVPALHVFVFLYSGLVRPEHKILNYYKWSPLLLHPTCWNKLDMLRLVLSWHYSTGQVVSCLVTNLLTPDGWKALSTQLADHSGQFTHEVVTCQPQIGRRSRKVRLPLPTS